MILGIICVQGGACDVACPFAQCYYAVFIAEHHDIFSVWGVNSL